MDQNAVNQMIQQALQQQKQQMQQQMQQAIAAAVAAAAPPAAAPAAAAGMDAAQFANVMAQMQQQNAAQMQQIAAQLAPLAAGAGPQPRFAAPTTFDGRSGTLDAWKADMGRQFAWYNTAADAARIRVASAHLKDAAGDWWSSIPAACRPTTWVDFITALEARFQPINSAELARSQLYALTQGKKTINEYVDSFRRLLGRLTDAAGQIDMAASDQLQHFRKGLRPAIALQIEVQGITTLDAAINAAVRVGSRYDLATASSSSSGSSSSQHRDAPMELDNIEGLEGNTDASDTDTSLHAPVTRAELKLMFAALQDKRRAGPSSSGSSSGGGKSNRQGRFAGQARGLPTIPHLSPDQVKEYMDNGKCFGCGSKDHTSRGCPKRKVGADGRVSWSN
jgi:hypothetical protein